MLQCGYFGLLLLLVWTEVNVSQDPTSCVQATNGTTSSSSPAADVKADPSLTQTGDLYLSCANANFLEFVWSVMMGIGYTVVAKNTQTAPLTVAFYISSYCLVAATSGKARVVRHHRHVYNHYLWLWAVASVTTSVVVSSIAGLTVMTLHYTFIAAP